MNKNSQTLALTLTLIISLLSLLTVYDTLSRFGFAYIINNIFSLPVIHTIYVFLILMLSFPALRFNFIILLKKRNQINVNMNNELIDANENETLQKRNVMIAWRWYYLFSVLFLLHPVMILIITLDSNISVNNPIGVTIIVLMNILMGIYLITNSRKSKTRYSTNT